MASLGPATLTSAEQALILSVTASNLRDHVIFSLALGTGLRLAEIVGLILEGFDQQRVPDQFRP